MRPGVLQNSITHTYGHTHTSYLLSSIQFPLHDNFVGDVVFSLHESAKEFGHVRNRPGDDVLRPHHDILSFINKELVAEKAGYTTASRESE